MGELRTTGMWGEPASRNGAVAVVRRAVELGADIVEVPVPFGPAADLFREADVQGVYVVARLTERLPDLDAVIHRLGGRRPDLVMAEEHDLEAMRDWPVRLGAIVGPRSRRPSFEPLRAVRGPWPAPGPLVDWCEENGLPYMAPSIEILGAGRLTVALPAVKTIKEVDRLFVPPPAARPAPPPAPVTPPTAGLG